MDDAKRAYDHAAEAWHTHALGCSTCTLHGDKRCEDGERLLRAENAAWDNRQDQRHMDYRPQIYVNIGGVVYEDWG